MIFSCHTCEIMENNAVRDQKQSKISVYIQLCRADQNCWRTAEWMSIALLLMSCMDYVLLGVISYSSNIIRGESWYDLAFCTFSISLMQCVCSVIHSFTISFHVKFGNTAYEDWNPGFFHPRTFSLRAQKLKLSPRRRRRKYVVIKPLASSQASFWPDQKKLCGKWLNYRRRV